MLVPPKIQGRLIDGTMTLLRVLSSEVRISHAVTTGFEEEDFLSPAGQRRKTLRSMTTSNLSISPTRSFASPSPSPERVCKLSRRSDPTLLSSKKRSPRRKSSKMTQLEMIKWLDRSSVPKELCLPHWCQMCQMNVTQHSSILI